MRQLHCPNIDVPSLRICNFGEVETLASAIGNLFRSDASCFGLELRAAHSLTRCFPEHEIDLRKCYYRIAQEPIILSNWRALSDLSLPEDDLAGLASVMAGTRIYLRATDMLSTGEGDHGETRFESLPSAKSWLSDIHCVDEMETSAMSKALYRFARIIYAHPFSDANGRFARGALLGALGAGGVISIPCMAITPTFYVYAETIRKALWGLSADGNWATYFDAMASVMRSCLDIARQVANTSSEKLEP